MGLASSTASRLWQAAQSWVMLAAVLGGVVAIVAAEAAGIAHVADVVGMRSPGDLHKRKDILAVEGDEFIAGRLDLGGLGGEHFRVLRGDRRPQLLRNFDGGFGFCGVVGLEQFQALLVDPGKIGADGSLGHGAVDGVLGGDKGVGGAVVAVDAIHHAAFPFGDTGSRVGGGKDGLGAVGVAFLHPGDGGAGLVGGYVFDVAEVGAVNAAQLGKRVHSAQMKDHDGLGLGVLLIIGKVGLDEQLFTDEAGRRVAAFADIARRAQVLHRRLNGPGIAMEGHLDELLGAVDLGGKVRSAPEPMWQATQSTWGVRGDFVRSVPATLAAPSSSTMSSGAASSIVLAILISLACTFCAAISVAPPEMTNERLANVPQP